MFKRKIKLNIKKLCYQSKLKKIAYFFPSKFCIFVLYNLKKDLLQEYLNSNLAKQVEAIYAMQVYASSKGFPKYFLAHLFNQMYDLEIIDEEAFYLWKDEINENYPDKGQALFHVN